MRDKFKYAIIKFNTKHRTRDAAWEVAHTINKSPDARNAVYRINGNALSVSCRLLGRVPMNNSPQPWFML